MQTWLGRTVRRLARLVEMTFEGSRPLAWLAVGHLALLVACWGLMLVDPRELAGASVWLKPAKFAASIATVSGTLALLLRHVRLSPKGGDRAIRIIASTAILEIAIIVFQAARGVPSHFNGATLFDGVLFTVMGAGITVFTLAVGYIAVAAFRQPFADRAFGWGIRLGFGVMLFGSAVAFIMPRPTGEQLASLEAGRPTPMLGAHSVGVEDGGPGLPVTRWSTEGGDLRVPHFVGLHALQVLPLVGWALGRRRRLGGEAPNGDREARLSQIAGLAYLGLTLTTLVGALRGRPLLSPDALTAVLGLALLGGCAIAAAVVIGRRRQAGARKSLTSPGSDWPTQFRLERDRDRHGPIGDGAIAQLAVVVGAPTLHDVLLVDDAGVRAPGCQPDDSRYADHGDRDGAIDGGAVTELPVVILPPGIDPSILGDNEVTPTVHRSVKRRHPGGGHRFRGNEPVLHRPVTELSAAVRTPAIDRIVPR